MQCTGWSSGAGMVTLHLLLEQATHLPCTVQACVNNHISPGSSHHLPSLHNPSAYMARHHVHIHTHAHTQCCDKWSCPPPTRAEAPCATLGTPGVRPAGALAYAFQYTHTHTHTHTWYAHVLLLASNITTTIAYNYHFFHTLSVSLLYIHCTRFGCDT